MTADIPVVDGHGVGSNPAGIIYFHFDFFAPSPLNGADAHAIKQYHSPVVIVVLDPQIRLIIYWSNVLTERFTILYKNQTKEDTSF